MAVRSIQGMIGGTFKQWRLTKFIPSLVIAAAVILFVSAILVIFSGIESAYSPATNKCISCHNDTGYPVDTDNDSVSAPYKRPHNNTLMCELCHGPDLHNISFIQPNGTYGLRSVSAGCPDCHLTKMQNFTSAPIIPALKHSSHPSNGSIWGTYWNASSSCSYCHGDTKHNITALGLINDLMIDTNNTRNGSLSVTTWCADCHLNGSNPNYRGNMWSPVPPLITVNNVGKAGWVDHSGYLTGGYKDGVCELCHALNGSYLPTSLNYSHSLDIGIAGAPNCFTCHDLGSPNAPAHVNFSAANQSVHSGMNSLNATSQGYAPVIGSCWACHSSTGNVASGHPDRYKTPKTCTECHLGAGTYNASQFNALIVSQHYYNGTTIKAGNSSSGISSCITCHENVTEMLIVNDDPDTGSFIGDGIRLTGGNRSFYHYGNPRPELRSGTNANCSYCHQNASTAFSGAMVNSSYNSSIQDHSRSISTPPCTFCHNTGWLHNSTLTRPALPLPNSTFCQNCHFPKLKHNGSVNCTNCHIDTGSRDTIHPIKYIQNTGSFNTSRTSAVNCGGCHQAKLSGFNEAPLIPATLKHSSHPSNGSIWGTYWNASSSCSYCHGDTKHNITALGLINDLMIDTNNTRNGSLSVTTWCADCHLNGSNPNYRGNMWSPVPPLITVNNVGKPGWVDHSGYLTGGYKDGVCELCHALNGPYLPTSLNYSHSLDIGIAGAPNCFACHDLGSPNAPAHVNFSAASQSVHSGMNSLNATSQGYPPVIGSCWACHSSTGNVASGHPDRYKTPKTCTECHLGAGTYNASQFNALIVSQHYYNGTTIKAGNSSSSISSCITCHENVTEMLIVNDDPDTGSFVGDGIMLTGGNRSFYHYGKPRPELRSGTNANCSYCHQNASTAFSGAMVNSSYNSSIQDHSRSISTPACTFCHNTGWLHNSTLTRPELPLPNSTFCRNCHFPKLKHNGSVNCTNCHIDTGSRDTIHPIKYIQDTGSFNTSGTSAVNCGGCHMTQFQGFPEVPIIPDLKHSNSLSAGRKWGNYWDNASTTTACYFCHLPDVHNASMLGNISLIEGSNIRNNQNLTNSMWCAACHYNNNSPNYRGNRINPEPPEILNRSGKVPGNASDGTRFFNHSEIQNYDDRHCENCHGGMLSGYLNNSVNFSHRVSEGGGGKDCISCHNRTATGAPINLRVDGSAIKKGIHTNLNSNAFNSSATDPVNKACWACHGDGTEPSGHPARYKSPRKCDSSDCHSLSQSLYKEKMVYSHFRNASLNANPGNATNYNITTSAQCQECHINSVVTKDEHTELAIVSHYGSKDELVDSFNCRYCHIDKDNSEDWGDATLINRNRTKLIELEKEKNKLTVYEGETIYLGEGYNLKLVDLTDTRDEALIQLSRENRTLDETSLPVGRLYKYETELVIDNSTVRTPVIVINITSIFKGKRSFIQFEGFRMRKIHSERESRNNTNCFACHLSRYSREKMRFQVIDREDKEDSSDIIYYTELFADLKSGNKSIVYYADENNVISQLRKGEKYISIPKLQKYLVQGEAWNIADNYALELNEVSTDSKLAWLTLIIDGAVAEDNTVPSGGWLNYTPGLKYRNDTTRNITVFSAKVSAISQGKPNFVILSDVYAISPNIGRTSSDSTLFGYNSSWLAPGETIMTGLIPQNLHVPELFTDQRGWGDCVKCHDTSWNLGIASIDAISTRLGKHSGLNGNASTGQTLSDNIDKACWACHTVGEEPMAHPPANIKPRKCTSCHTYQENPTYGAINVGTEAHGLEPNCENCHYIGSHNVVRFQVTPGINDVSISPERPGKGEKVILAASAQSGYRMSIKAAEYFIDTIEESGNGMPLKPVDGAFDSQKEDLTAEINTSGINAGEHVIYIHAMERDNRWGTYYPMNFTIVEPSTSGILDNLKTSIYSEWSVIVYLIIVIIVAYFAISGRRL